MTDQERMSKQFPISVITRNAILDLTELTQEQVEAITDEEMTAVVEWMENDLNDGVYFGESLDNAVREVLGYEYDEDTDEMVRQSDKKRDQMSHLWDADLPLVEGCRVVMSEPGCAYDIGSLGTLRTIVGDIAYVDWDGALPHPKGYSVDLDDIMPMKDVEDE